MRALLTGTKRFGELKKSLTSISQKVYAEVPPRVEYSLTDIGRSLIIIHDAMWQWGEEYKRIMNDFCK